MSKKPYPLNLTPALHSANNNLTRARAFIDDCFAAPLDLDQMASQAHYSRYHFIRIFSKTFAQTPHQYLTQKRIEKAKELLKASDLSVTAVCFAVGFESLGSFSALFQKHVGRSPQNYRQRIFAVHKFPHRFIPACYLIMNGVQIPRHATQPI